MRDAGLKSQMLLNVRWKEVHPVEVLSTSPNPWRAFWATQGELRVQTIKPKLEKKLRHSGDIWKGAGGTGLQLVNTARKDIDLSLFFAHVS